MSVYYAQNKGKIKNKVKTLIQHMCNTSHFVIRQRTLFCRYVMAYRLYFTLYIWRAVLLYCRDCERPMECGTM